MSKEHIDNKRLQHRWSHAIKDRDGWACVKCGKETGRLESHHKVPLEEGGTWDLSNGETLCQKCHISHHMKIRYKDDPDGRAWYDYLKQLRKTR